MISAFICLLEKKFRSAPSCGKRQIKPNHAQQDQSINFVIPAKAGIQFVYYSWMPFYNGMTKV